MILGVVAAGQNNARIRRRSVSAVDAIFVAVAQRDLKQAESQLTRTMSAVESKRKT